MVLGNERATEWFWVGWEPADVFEANPDNADTTFTLTHFERLPMTVVHNRSWYEDQFSKKVKSDIWTVTEPRPALQGTKMTWGGKRPFLVDDKQKIDYIKLKLGMTDM